MDRDWRLAVMLVVQMKKRGIHLCRNSLLLLNTNARLVLTLFT